MPPAVRFISFSPTRRPEPATQPVHFANMALLDLVVEAAETVGWDELAAEPELN